MTLGAPRVHRRRAGSTNADARALAIAGAPHGTLVTAAEQTEGHGRQGRRWFAPSGTALLCSLVVRDPPPLLSLRAGVAVAELAGSAAMLKWPNDVLLEGRKVSGILVEARPSEGWAVLGIGINVAVVLSELPAELHESAGTLGLGRGAIEPTLEQLLQLLAHWLAQPPQDVLDAWRARDALLGAEVRWRDGRGVGAGIGEDGRLRVALEAGGEVALNAGEVHLSGTGADGERDGAEG
jgi:BirA family biotin operon repressor/biotin-[acetyl-CoA-carboxylase] ligase